MVSYDAAILRLMFQVGRHGFEFSLLAWAGIALPGAVGADGPDGNGGVAGVAVVAGVAAAVTAADSVDCSSAKTEMEAARAEAEGLE